MVDDRTRANAIQKRIINEFCKQEFANQVTWMCSRFGLVDYNPILYINHSPKAAASYGGELTDGEPFITLALKTINSCVGKQGYYLYEEYEFLRNKPGIGDASTNWKQYCAFLIAHELAHTIVEINRFADACKHHFSTDVTRDKRAHGKYWQEVYRIIRNEYCTRDRYPVEFIDFEDHVHHVVERRGGQQCITVYRGFEPVGYYIRDAQKLYKSNLYFVQRRLTKHRSIREIKKHHQNAG